MLLTVKNNVLYFTVKFGYPSLIIAFNIDFISSFDSWCPPSHPSITVYRYPSITESYCVAFDPSTLTATLYHVCNGFALPKSELHPFHSQSSSERLPCCLQNPRSRPESYTSHRYRSKVSLIQALQALCLDTYPLQKDMYHPNYKRKGHCTDISLSCCSGTTFLIVD